MAPTPDQLSSPGSVSYDSDTMVVGDGTWDFTKNTFLLPPLEGTDFDTMRYNGMGNRFSTVHQYHTIILAHGIMAAMVFLFLIPFSVMLARFYTREPAHAIRYHARLHVFSGLLLTAAFILPFFAVGPKRSLSNPHHGIGIAIYIMFVVQLFAGRLIQHIMKSRSLRVTLHKWLGRATALLGIVQVPLGLTLYGSPKVLFILYAVWMGFLLAVYFVLNYRAEGHHERYIPAGRSEAGTRITESEYYSDHREHEHEHSNLKWLGPLAAGAGIFALMRGRKKDHDDDRSRARTRSPSMSRTSITRSRGPTVISSRPSYFSEKYSDLPAQRSGGGGLFKALGGAAAAFGAGKVFSNFMDRRNQRDEEYSAVSTDLPHRNRSVRAATVSEFNSEYTDDVSTIPPSRAPAPTQTTSAYGGPRSPRRSNVRSNISRGDMMDESEYSSYVSPSRRPHDEPSGGGGFAKGVLGALGVGWFAKKFADRRARKEEEDRLREEEEMRSGTQFSRYSNTEYQSPIRRDSHRPPQRRSTVTGTEYSEMTESSFDTQTELSTMPPKGPRNTAAGVRPSTSALISDETSPPRRGERLSMPSMPSDPHGVLHRAGSESDITSLADRPQGRHPSRRQMDSERAAAEAAARASSLAAREQRRGGSSQTSGPARPRDDKEQVRLRKVTEEETLAQTSRGRRNSQSSLSALESPTKNRRYRRDDSKRRAESAAESRVESSRVGSSSRVQDEASRLGPLNPPGPSLSNPKRRGRDSGYNSGQPPAQQSGQPSQSGPSFLQPPGQGLPNASITSAGSHGTWSGMESDVSTEVPTAPRNPPQSTQRYPPQSTPHQPPPADDKGNESAADNRRRRRAERRRASGSRPSGTENTYDTSTYDENDGF